MARPPVTAIIHTLNEIEQIEECMRSVEWADEIYLVDSLSTDGTVQRVREKFPRARIEEREYLGAASTKNYAIDRASHVRVLRSWQAGCPALQSPDCNYFKKFRLRRIYPVN